MQSQVSFELINGKRVFQIFSQPDNPSKKLVIMSHGFRGTSIGPARTFVDFERLLLQQGFSVLRFDQPGSGNSEGDFIDSSFREWISTTAYFANKYIDEGYAVALLGQSMGATTSMAVAAQPGFKGKIPCLMLWVPDAKSSINLDPKAVDEEGGQKVSNRFWMEAKEADFFGALSSYSGGIHLVYGETDRYVTESDKQQAIKMAKDKGQPVMILSGQDHSSWDFDAAQKVYEEEIQFLKKYFH